MPDDSQRAPIIQSLMQPQRLALRLSVVQLRTPAGCVFFGAALIPADQFHDRAHRHERTFFEVV